MGSNLERIMIGAARVLGYGRSGVPILSGGRPVIGRTRTGKLVYPIAGGDGTFGDVIDRGTNADNPPGGQGPVELPPEVAGQIISAMPGQSAAFRLMRRVNMSSRLFRQPVTSLLPLAYWVGGDTGLKQTTAEQWKNVYLVAAELAAIIPIPEALIADQAYPLWDEITPALIEAAGLLVDAAVLFGVGFPSVWQGVAIEPGAVAAGNVLTRGSIANQDVSVDIGGEAGVMQLVEADGFAVNGFAVAPTFRAVLRGLRDQNGQPVFLSGIAGPTTAQQDTLYGVPAAYINNGAFDTSRAELFAGDWSKALLGIRQDISLERFREGVISDDDGKVILNLMQQDSAAVRMTMRVGYATANPATRLQGTEADRFPFAVLRPTGYTGS